MSKPDRAGNNKRSTGSRKTGAKTLILLLLVFAACFFILSDSEGVAWIRSGLLRQIGIGAEPGDIGGSAGDDSPAAGEVEFAALRGNSVAASELLPVWSGDYYEEIDGGIPAFPQQLYDEAGLMGGGKAETKEADNGADAYLIAARKGLWKTEGTLKGIDSRRLNTFEHYGDLDDLGRCTAAYGCLGLETMPIQGEQRGDISDIHPSGWAYGQGWERSHLIAWALGAENANEANLVTGTHYFNHDGMRPLEEEVEHYIWNTGGHVLYMVRPVFAGDELVPRGVQMSAWSAEDEGESISFNVYCFNVNPGAEIDYHTGIVTTEQQAAQGEQDYVLNARSGVFHYPECEGAKSMSSHNRREIRATRSEMTSRGYVPCGECRP